MIFKTRRIYAGKFACETYTRRLTSSAYVLTFDVKKKNTCKNNNNNLFKTMPK